MIKPISAANLSAPEKAQLIYEQARSDMAGRLWRAALGVEEPNAAQGNTAKEGPMSLNLLLALLDERGSAPLPSAPQAPVIPQKSASDGADADGQRRQAPPQPMVSAVGEDGAGSGSSGRGGYGPNAGYAGILEAAGRRTGLPPAALATIVHAEAAKDRNGRWLPYSRNPRSSAAGLGQFLSSTWLGEAAREGTWLNQMARQQGWLGKNGKVMGEHRSAMLSLRYNPEAAIQATADYAAANLAALRKAGAAIEGGAQGIAQAAYLGHHLGRGDAIRFLKGGLHPERAQILLKAQIGTAAANRQIAAVGDAALAHKSWLNNYIKKNIQAAHFDG